MKTEPLPCPFCGGNAIVAYITDYEQWCVECTKCGGAFLASTEQRSIVGWNNRQYMTDVERKLQNTLMAFRADVLAAALEASDYDELCGQVMDLVDKYNP